MRAIFANFGRFFRDERGVFLPLFAVMAIAIVAVAGAVVDYVRLDSARNEAQIALDAAALALQPDIYGTSKTVLKNDANKFVKERLSKTDASVEVDDIETDTTAGSIYLHAHVTVPMTFLELVGISQMKTALISQATRKKLYLEVAFVLDNSGSMASYSRMTNLKSAATCATNIIFYGNCNPASGATPADNVKAGVVPFNIFVNVGAGNASASWMDTSGLSSVSKQNFDNDDNDSNTFAGPVDRFALYNNMNNVSWKGCVEARPYPLSVNDTAPTSSDPDTLFVPEFAPDEPDSGSFYNDYTNDDPIACRTLAGTCDRSGSKWSGYTYKLTDLSGNVQTSSHSSLCSCSGSYPCSYYPPTTGLTDREKQERLCKYQGASVSGGYGPNAMCINTSILPLTDSPSTIISKINSMVADGGTNIHAGAIWGYRVLSPGEPFTQGRAYDTAVSKVMILMTDGENTYYTRSNMNKASYFYPFGYLWNAQQDATRLGTSSLYSSSDVEDQMDKLTVESCDAAKAAGIKVYTIGLDPPSQSTKDMLTACATDASHAYFPTNSSELNTVFENIANQLADLRLEK